MLRFRFRQPLTAAVLLFLFGAVMAPLAAQDFTPGIRKELGFWVGASTTVPGTELDDVLDSAMGGGIFLRLGWPWIFSTEIGTSYMNYSSRTTQTLTLAPVYGALVYQLPVPFRINTYVKLGGGSAHLIVRPDNKSGWDPMAYAGLEFSILASRRLRIGLRTDYYLVYEKHLKSRAYEEWVLMNYAIRGSAPTAAGADPRYLQLRDFRVHNGHFFNFGLMMSYAL